MTIAKRFFLVFFAWIALAFAALAFATSAADAKGRVALVIGNNAYPNLAANQQLANAISDARAMRDTLKGLGFEVIYGENLNRSAMVDRLSELTAKLSNDDTALFFYAGHGVSFSGANYLLPVDVPAPRSSGRAEEARLADQAVGETQIIDRITASGAAVTILVLDACRDNPLQSADRRSLGSTRGLGQGNPARGVFSIYSAGHGQAALDRLGADDRNPNSVFTRVFLEKLKTPGLSLQSVALQTRSAVVDLTRKVGHDQFPAYYDQIVGGEVFLAGLPSATPAPSAPAPQPRVDPDAAARGDYALAERANSRAGWDAFLQRYPSGYYADLGRSQRDKLAALDARPPAPRPEPAPVPQAVPPQPQAAPNLNPVPVPSANFPTKPVRLVVPFAPGGAADYVARLLSDSMSRSLGQPVVIENRVGAAGTIGLQAVSTSPADGYTVVIASNSALSISPLILSAQFDAVRDFAPVGQIASSPLVLVVGSSSKARTLREFIDQARSNSGKLNYASTGAGSLSHLAMELLMKNTGTSLVHIPFSGTADALTAISSGRAEAMLIEANSAAPQINSGAFRALAVAAPRRSAKLPSVPTMAEAGVTGVEAALSYGMLAPKNTPPAVIAKLNAVLRNATVDASIRQKLADSNLEPAPGTPQDFGRAIAAESARWSTILRETRLIKAN